VLRGIALKRLVRCHRSPQPGKATILHVARIWTVDYKREHLWVNFVNSVNTFDST